MYNLKLNTISSQIVCNHLSILKIHARFFISYRLTFVNENINIFQS